MQKRLGYTPQLLFVLWHLALLQVTKVSQIAQAWNLYILMFDQQKFLLWKKDPINLHLQICLSSKESFSLYKQ